MKKYTYIRELKEKLEKYEIVVVNEELEKLKKIIINQCGFIEKIEGDETNIPDINDHLHIKNYKEEKIINKLTFEETYRISYIKYNDSPLATLLDRLLKGDLTSLIEIKKYDKLSLEYCNENLKKQITDLRKKVTFYISNSEMDKAERTLEQIEKMKETLALNENQKNDIIYYDVVNKCIDYQLVDKLSLKEYKKVKQFFNEVPLNHIMINQNEKTKKRER